MKAPGRLVVILACSVFILASCQKINLGGGKNGGGGNTPATTGGGNTGGNPFGGGGQQQAAGLPLLDGEWELDYEFKGTPYQGNVQIAQQGNGLAGEGTDQDGKQWALENGQIDGVKVVFQKKYATGSPPIDYTGELKHESSPEYTGWLMEGTYVSKGPSGQVTGKWVANPLSPLQEPQAAAPAQQTSFFQPANTNPPAQQASQGGNDNLGDVQPADLSGKYEGTYTYQFKKVATKMWLRNDGHKITGDGTDIIGKTSSRFAISKGWYQYPEVTLVRQYTKGNGATETRTMKFKAKISSNGRDIVMKGETEYGGAWNAHLVR